MGAAARLFFEVNPRQETLNQRVRPSDQQLELLRNKKADLDAHLTIDLRDRCGAAISTWVQGSYKFHTLIRPVNRHDEYDVDVGVYVEWGNADGDLLSAAQIRGYLQESILAFKDSDASVRKVEEPPKARCSRTYFDKQFHIDTPAYHHNVDTSVARLAVLPDKWENSDPEKMVAWFQARLDGDDRAQVRRLVRYLKAWAALCLSRDNGEKPSSLLLTVLCVEAYLETIRNRELEDDDALGEVIDSIFQRLSRDRCVENPVNSDDDRDLNRMSHAGFESFKDKLEALRDVAFRATACADEADAAVIWAEVFDYLFPLPDVIGLAEMADQQRGIMVLTPDIRIYISRTEGGPVLRTYNGQVDLVRLGEWLRFRILNPEVLPPNATVRWIVRNEGEDAYSANDLGHSASDHGRYEHDEIAAYIGRHFLDCEVRVGGQLRSVTRVPVFVTQAQVPPRHAPRPDYVRLRRIR